MKKLLNGIVNFRSHKRDAYLEEFKKLAKGQTPDALFIACSDSRVVPNLFASTDPGDLFVLRNVGNIVPMDLETNRGSVIAALEYSVQVLGVSDIIICGHSECGAIQALFDPSATKTLPGVQNWLSNVERDKVLAGANKINGPDVSEINKISLSNVLVQVDQLKRVGFVHDKIKAGKLRLNAWWFELETANVYIYDFEQCRFDLLEGELAQKLIKNLESNIKPNNCC